MLLNKLLHAAASCEGASRAVPPCRITNQLLESPQPLLNDKEWTSSRQLGVEV